MCVANFYAPNVLLVTVVLCVWRCNRWDDLPAAARRFRFIEAAELPEMTDRFSSSDDQVRNSALGSSVRQSFHCHRVVGSKRCQIVKVDCSG